MNVTPPSLSSTAAQGAVSVGDKVVASVVSNNAGNLILNVRGVLAQAVNSHQFTQGKSVRVEVVQTEPKVIVKILPQSQQGNQVMQGDISQKAALIKESAQGEAVLSSKDSSVLLKETVALMAKETATFSQKDIVSLLKNLGGARIAAFLPEEIRKAVRNGGNFFENKLLKGLSVENDSKTIAYSSGNDTARGAVTKMQIANILMNTDFFTFFEGDEALDFDGGVMRFRRSSSGGISLHMKINFSNLGETVISFVKAGDEGYYVTVRTKQDISNDLAYLKLPNLIVNWAELKADDSKFFEIDKKDIFHIENLDLKA